MSEDSKCVITFLLIAVLSPITYEHGFGDGIMYSVGLRIKHKQDITKLFIVIGFLFIPLMLVAVFSYYPLFKLFQLSFTDWNGATSFFEYIGLENYYTIFSDGEVFATLKNNLAYAVISIVQIAFGIYLAVILNDRLKGRNFFKSIIFMPYIINGVAVAFMFNFMYDYQNGPLNVFLRNFGLGSFAVRWLGDNYSINFSLAFINLWRFLGFTMVIFLGALQSISNELYEAADIDGATFFQKIRFITLPGIKRVIELNLLLGINGSLQVFFEPFVITNGGPGGLSETFVTKTLKMAFNFQNFGAASAMGVVLLIIILLLVGGQRLVSREEIE